MRSYGQYCSIARALDVVGDRWTLLIVRELLLRGPSRFSDLRSGLPGVASNLLTERLRDLESAGLISHERAAPPVSSGLYSLTESGRGLEPVLRELGRWGLPLMQEERADDAFRAEWLAYAPTFFGADAVADGPAATVQLEAGGEQAVLELRDGEVHGRVGVATDPDVVVRGAPRAVLGLLTGAIDRRRARSYGLSVRGDRSVLDRLIRK